jgi:hypothetical protein
MAASTCTGSFVPRTAFSVKEFSFFPTAAVTFLNACKSALLYFKRKYGALLHQVGGSQ